MDRNEKLYSKPLTIYFDSLCSHCCDEINQYLQWDVFDRIRIVDIRSEEFSVEREKIDPLLIRKTWHVKTSTGVLMDGIEGYDEIWRVLDLVEIDAGEFQLA